MKVDSNIPIPKILYNSKYPWGKLKIGDSFYVKGYDKIKHASIMGSAHSWD